MIYNIDEVIEKIHKCARNNNCNYIPTEKNRRTKDLYFKNGLERNKILLSLTKEHLFKGPVYDRDKPNEYLYIFKYYYNKKLITLYIKIKIMDNHIKVLSFHEDE